MYEKCSFNDWCVINKSNTISVCFLIFLKNSPIEKKKKKKKKKTGKQFRGKCVDRREAGKNPAGLRSLFSVVTRFCERFGAVSTHSVAESEFDRTEPNYTGRSPRRRRFDLKRFLFFLSLSPLPFSSSFLKPSPRERRIFATVVRTWLISSRTSYFRYLLGLVWVFFLFFFPSVSFVYRHNKKMKKMSRRRLEDFFVFFLIINIRLLD